MNPIEAIRWRILEDGTRRLEIRYAGDVDWRPVETEDEPFDSWGKPIEAKTAVVAKI